MVKLKLITVGKSRQKSVLQGEREYAPRLKSLAQFEIVEIENSKFGTCPPAERRKKESAAVAAKLKAEDFLILLDEDGRSLSSEELAGILEARMNQGVSTFCFAIGGAYGWDKSIQARANLCLSLSRLTFSYQIARLVMLEQIYRVLSIIKGHPYHK